MTRSLRQLSWFGLFLLSFFHSACLFGPNRVGSVRSFSHHDVQLNHGVHYRVGELPHDWQRVSSKARVASFYHASYASTIYSSAFCAQQFEDLRLTELAHQLEHGLESRSKAKYSDVLLGKHQALRSQFQGILDGRIVFVDAIVLKQAGCNFDFVLIQSAPSSQAALRDFQAFYQGFVLLPKKLPPCHIKRWCS